MLNFKNKARRVDAPLLRAYFIYSGRKKKGKKDATVPYRAVVTHLQKCGKTRGRDVR
jgi:hypothetical protein